MTSCIYSEEERKKGRKFSLFRRREGRGQREEKGVPLL